MPLFVGFEYQFKYRFNDAVLRQATPGGGLTPITQGRLQVRNWTIRYDQSGFFQVVVSPDFRTASTYSFNARYVSVGTNVADQIVLADGTFRVPVWAMNSKVTVDVISCSFLPLNLVGAEYEFEYATRSQRI